jgi:hypothetical protein
MAINAQINLVNKSFRLVLNSELKNFDNQLVPYTKNRVAVIFSQAGKI